MWRDVVVFLAGMFIGWLIHETIHQARAAEHWHQEQLKKHGQQQRSKTNGSASGPGA